MFAGKLTKSINKIMEDPEVIGEVLVMLL